MFYHVHQKHKTKVSCQVSGNGRWVAYFRKLLFECSNEKFSPGRVQSKKICSQVDLVRFCAWNFSENVECQLYLNRQFGIGGNKFTPGHDTPREQPGIKTVIFFVTVSSPVRNSLTALISIDHGISRPTDPSTWRRSQITPSVVGSVTSSCRWTLISSVYSIRTNEHRHFPGGSFCPWRLSSSLTSPVRPNSFTHAQMPCKESHATDTFTI